jgi:hypothetical protein
MRVVIPFLDERFKLRTQVIFSCKVDDSQAFPLDNADPLFDVIHPRTMHGCEMHDNTRMVGYPFADFFPMMGTDMVAHQMNGMDALVTLGIPRFQKGDAFPLTLPFITVPIDLASTGVQGGKEMEGPCARILVLGPGGNLLRLGWPGRSVTRSRLQRGLLVHRQDHLIWTQRPCVEVNERGHGGREGGISRLFGIQPDMRAPGFELRCRQHPSHGGGGDVLNDPVRAQLPRQFGTIPRGQAAAQRIRALAGQAYHVDGDLGGKTRPWPRGQGRRPARPDAAPSIVWPTGARPRVGGRPVEPPGMGSVGQPVAGSSSHGVPSRRPWWSTAASAPRSRVLWGTG